MLEFGTILLLEIPDKENSEQPKNEFISSEEVSIILQKEWKLARPLLSDDQIKERVNDLLQRSKEYRGHGEGLVTFYKELRTEFPDWSDDVFDIWFWKPTPTNSEE